MDCTVTPLISDNAIDMVCLSLTIITVIAGFVWYKTYEGN